MDRNEINGVLGGCKECGRRIPTRNNQLNMACQQAGLCRSCYEASTTVCKECGQKLPRLTSNMAKDEPVEAVIIIACQEVRLCRYCYDAFAPENEGKTTLQEVLDRVGGDYSQFIADADEESDGSPYGWLDQFFGKDR